MINFATISTFLFTILSAFYFNKSKTIEYNAKYAFESIIDGLFSFAVIYAIFLQGYMRNLFIFVILLVVYFLFAYIRFRSEQIIDDFLLQVETVKNIILLFIRSILLFFVLLTIFRFYNAPVQIIFATGITYGFNKLLINNRERINTFITNIWLYLFIASAVKLAAIGVVIAAIVGQFFIFNYPVEKLTKHLNLEHRSPIYNITDHSYTLINNFKDDKTETIYIEDHTYSSLFQDKSILMDGDHAYLASFGLFRYFDKVQVVNLDNETLVNGVRQSCERSDENKVPIIGYDSAFFNHNQSVFISGRCNLYRINDSQQISEMLDASVLKNGSLFYNDNTLNYIVKEDDITYLVYQFIGSEFVYDRTIDLSELPFLRIVIINQELYYATSDQYINVYDLSMSFPNYSSTLAIHENIVYYSRFNEINQKTEYVKYNIDTEEETMVSQGPRANRRLIYNDGYLYLLPLELGNIQIMDSDLNVIANINQVESDSFVPNSEAIEDTIFSYTATDDGLTYVQLDRYEESTKLLFNDVSHRSVDLKLTFYSFYGLSTLFTILLTSLIPITNSDEDVNDSESVEIKNDKKDGLEQDREFDPKHHWFHH